MKELNIADLATLESLYLDTNIIFRLYGYWLGSSDARDQTIGAWCRKLADNNVPLYASLLNVSELLHKLIAKKIELYCVRKGIPYKTPKDFRTKYETDYQRVFKEYANVYAHLPTLFQQFKVHLIFPNDPEREIEEINDLVFQYAGHIHSKYPILDPADTFHIAIADYCGIRNILTLDSDFKTINELAIYTIGRNKPKAS